MDADPDLRRRRLGGRLSRAVGAGYVGPAGRRARAVRPEVQPRRHRARVVARSAGLGRARQGAAAARGGRRHRADAGNAARRAEGTGCPDRAAARHRAHAGPGGDRPAADRLSGRPAASDGRQRSTRRLPSCMRSISASSTSARRWKPAKRSLAGCATATSERRAPTSSAPMPRSRRWASRAALRCGGPR